MSTPIDTLRDSFLRLVAEGMSHHEAMLCFDEEEWRKAMWEELETLSAVRDATGNLVTNDERRLPALLELSSMASFEARSAIGSHDMDQAMELWAAGWTSEVPNPEHHGKHGFWSHTQVMSFYWRRPPRRPGKPGRRYLSTNQAWMALKREQDASTTGKA